jgi:DNA-binding SARP family transcriptional activator
MEPAGVRVVIELTTFGRATIRRDGEELRSIARHKQKFAFLTYLAVEGQASRDRLLAVFWPEREEERARHSLSQILYALKRELGEECLRVQPDSVSVDNEACTIDAAKLERAAESEDWEGVIQLYAGPFLDQFALPGAAEFEDWQSTTRARLTSTR